jgi:hypothetical protein
MPLFWTLVFVAMPALGSQQQTTESDLLSDSELVYQVSGGFAGVVRTARLIAKSGNVTAEYAASDERAAGPQEGAREPARYLELWAEAERAGIWTLRVPGKQKGADLMHHELVARVGERRHSVSWTDGETSSPSARDALRIGESILALAREAAAEK